jgi:hypothetical protein
VQGRLGAEGRLGEGGMCAIDGLSMASNVGDTLVRGSSSCLPILSMSSNLLESTLASPPCLPGGFLRFVCTTAYSLQQGNSHDPMGYRHLGDFSLKIKLLYGMPNLNKNCAKYNKSKFWWFYEAHCVGTFQL